MRHPTILQRDQTLLLIVDFQERMIPAMSESKMVQDNILKLIKAFNILELPAIVSEQYPKGLGHTVSTFTPELRNANVMEKIHFSCCSSQEIWEAIDEHKRSQILVAGIEAHVCVQQTVLDLLHDGYQAHVLFDAITSRNPANKENALERMRSAGAIITNLESALFELMIHAGIDEFKPVQKLII